MNNKKVALITGITKVWKSDRKIVCSREKRNIGFGKGTKIDNFEL